MLPSNICHLNNESPAIFIGQTSFSFERYEKQCDNFGAHRRIATRVIKLCLKIQIVIDYIEAPSKVLHQNVAETTDQNLHCNAANQSLQE